MKAIIFSLLIFSPSIMPNTETGVVKDIINDPVISRRCKALLRDRNDKIKVKQRLNTMFLRSERLEGQLRPSQQQAKHRLKLNQTQIKNNIKLTNIRIKSMEENIIRKGCPGITL